MDTGKVLAGLVRRSLVVKLSLLVYWAKSPANEPAIGDKQTNTRIANKQQPSERFTY